MDKQGSQSLQLSGDRVRIERGGRLVLDGLSFAVAAGAALVVTGPNGAGKSTLLRAIAGLIPLAAGSIRLSGGDADRPLSEHCHYFGHLDGLKSALSVAENCAFWHAFLSGGGAASTVTAALADVGLDHLASLPAAYLSAGQRRRLSFARLLVAHRPVWLLDEPTAALDGASEARLVALVNRHLTAGGLVVAATHAPLAFDAVARLDLSEGVAA